MPKISPKRVLIFLSITGRWVWAVLVRTAFIAYLDEAISRVYGRRNRKKTFFKIQKFH